MLDAAERSTLLTQTHRVTEPPPSDAVKHGTRNEYEPHDRIASVDEWNDPRSLQEISTIFL